LEQEDPFGLDESDESEPETKKKKGKGKKKKGKGKKKKGKGKKKSPQDTQHKHALAVVGPIPPFWRIKLSAAGFLEHDNAFRYMLNQGLYASCYDNNVYASRSAYQAAEIEENKRRSCGSPKDQTIYHRVTYDMPMTGVEVNRLISISYDDKVHPYQQGEAFMLL
jgi:hypothetical protein